MSIFKSVGIGIIAACIMTAIVFSFWTRYADASECTPKVINVQPQMGNAGAKHIYLCNGGWHYFSYEWMGMVQDFPIECPTLEGINILTNHSVKVVRAGERLEMGEVVRLWSEDVMKPLLSSMIHDHGCRARQ